MDLTLEERLRSTAVIGAAGKMGNGIAWVLLQAMAGRDAKANGVPGSGQYELTLIDNNAEGLRRLREYLRDQARKFAEKRITSLREWAKDRADLVENGEIISAFVEGTLSCLRFDTDLTAAKRAKLVFEAVFEDLALKTGLYWKLKGICPADTYFFTNTSSIPIAALDQGADLRGRILGYHFYNPPAVQKLVEVISHSGTLPDLVRVGTDLGPILEKVLVPSSDVAGFIGNGHFIREGLFALEKFKELRQSHDPAEALFLTNKVTQDFLLRPMGMFQLMDYVGLDVFEMILGVMRRYIQNEAFESDVLSWLLTSGVRGGQAGSGEQKDGFFKYAKNKIVAVYHLGEKQYVDWDEKRLKKSQDGLGPMPEPILSWHGLSKDPERKAKLAAYFQRLSGANTPGAKLAREFLIRSREISEGLVASGVAKTREDVSAVLVNGFHHLYGPFDTGI